MDPNTPSLEERLSRLESLVTDNQLKNENEVNSLFYSMIGGRLRKPIIEEIVEMAVLEHFNVTSVDFRGRHFLKNGRPERVKTEEDKSIVESRKWFLSIMTYVLRKTSFALALNYPFYHVRSEKKHRPVFMAAMDPKCEKDQKNREVLLAITTIVKRICEAEGVLSEDFHYI